MFSSAARAVRDWWNVRDRGLPTGIWNCASSLGPTIAPPLLTVLMISFGWRWMFVSMGLLGIVVAIVWYTVYREAAEAALSSGEARHLTRPKMMTVTAIIAGLLPILWSHGTGSELMQRIAVPMIGGMVSSTMLTLIVIPAIYATV
jgi:MFS family permease